MARLSIYLPPFASDYTGVCSALFPYRCLTAINDASCCTAHYVFCDEPRWQEAPHPTFSTQLRNMDAILGNDDRVVEGVLQAERSLKPPMVAVVGTPVPAIIGMDMQGISCEIAAQCDVPVLGFDTNGFDYYDKGIVAVGKALITRFAQPPTEPIAPQSINILGMTPMDYGNVGNERALVDFLQSRGYRVNCGLFLEGSTAALTRLSQAALNLAVSAAGLVLAKLLHRRYQMPFLAAAPMGEDYLAAALQNRLPQKEALQTGRPVLLIGDQVMANSLRDALYLAGCRKSIFVASFFGWSAELSQEGDCFLPDETALLSYVQQENFAACIGDPELFACPLFAQMALLPLVHPAVSGKLHWAETSCYLSEDFGQQLADMAGRLNQLP